MKLTGRQVACLLSDCDGVIVDSEVVADRIMVDVLGAAFERSDLEDLTKDLFGLRVIDIIESIEKRVRQPLSLSVRISLQQEIDAAVAERAPAMPDTADVYRQLGLPIAVVSNSAFPRLYRSVERAGLLPLVGRYLYSAEDVGRPKPAPDAYVHAALQLGMHPSDCLVIEDSATGVRAARAAGMRVIGFLGGSHIEDGHTALLSEAGAMAVFTSMRELPDLIGR
ncbi:MAG: HAD family hydrolase [Variovorax sp.]